MRIAESNIHSLFFYKNTSLKKSKRSEHFNNTAEAQIEIQLETRFDTVTLFVYRYNNNFQKGIFQ